MKDLGSVASYSVKYDRKIHAICKPLLDSLQIPYFSYYQIHADGKFIKLSNFTAQLEFYYSQNFYLTNPYLTHPHLMRSGCVLTATTPSPDYLESIEVSQRKFQFNNTFLMVKRSGQLVEGFLFGTQNSDPNYSNHYLNNIELLKKFNRYFIQETDQLVNRMHLEGYNLHAAKGTAFLERNPNLPLSNNDLNAKHFLKSISPLSVRELDCLELFRQGNSAQATAAKLGLSRRTVEHYFESIKNKLNCSSKWDLLNIG